MPRTDQFTMPDAGWDVVQQTCYDQQTGAALPNYTGLCVVRQPVPMVMNTWLDGGTRKWSLVCLGYMVPNKVLEEILT